MNQTYVSTCEKKADDLIASIPSKMENLFTFLNTSFPQRDSLELFKNNAATDGKKNAEMVNIVNHVRSHLLTAMNDCATLERWIVLMVPKAEDGNNFGVEVQKYVMTAIKAMSTSLNTTWTSLPDYFSQRGAAIEKAMGSNKTSNDVSKTSTKSNSKGGKDGDQDTSSDVDVTKTSTSTSTPIEDYDLQVNAIDVKWYFNLLAATENIVDNYATALDILSKNDKKVRLPRGNKEAGHHSMF